MRTLSVKGLRTCTEAAAIAVTGGLLLACAGSDLAGSVAHALGFATGYKVGGSVNGLGDTGVVLEDNRGDSLAVSRNGSFTFAKRVAARANYSVSVQTQPAGQTCTVTNGSGTVWETNVMNVMVSCSGNTYAVGGTVIALTAQGLILADNGGDRFRISGNGSFTFPKPLTSGTGYAVSIASQPDNRAQTCAVTNGTGTVGQTNVTNVTVSCVSPVATAATVIVATPVEFGFDYASSDLTPRGAGRGQRSGGSRHRNYRLLQASPQA